jgi:hypothetical protein
MMIEYRTRELTGEQSREMVEWLIANTRHKVRVVGFFGANNYLFTPEKCLALGEHFRLEGTDKRSLGHRFVRFGSKGEAMLFRLRWC